MIIASEKKCRICEETKLAEYFYKHKTNKDGLHSYCKECVKEKTTKWQQENRDRYNKWQREYIKTETARNNRREAAQEWRDSGGYREWTRENADKVNSYNLYRRMNKTHTISNGEWIACKNYFNDSCAYCGISEEDAKEQQGNYLHKEHVEHNGSNGIENCVPACKSCNSRKWECELNEWFLREFGVDSQDRLDRVYAWLDNGYLLYMDQSYQ
ncbi:HNH endonuclease signature motif containing protein [Lederbergia citrisecunda]|uniref:HNH endonuclease signature motif containing protein n=1 Tax=Lederbergia citrisecunda TaxID=2833583 RepID=UPI003D2CD657